VEFNQTAAQSPRAASDRTNATSYSYLNLAIAALALVGISSDLIFRIPLFPALNFLSGTPSLVVLVLGGTLLIFNLIRSLIFEGKLGSDILAAIAIVTSLFLGEYLAGALVVLMLSGGSALEDYAMRRASSVLDALAKRSPSIAHIREGVNMRDLTVGQIRPGDELVVLPHELCPVDGVVIEGRGSMDESYLTGEPYRISKVPGCEVISGAINGQSVLVIRALKEAIDSRYHKIMQVMDASRQKRPRLRRLADRLGIVYTPLALLISIAAWVLSGDASRGLSVLVVATPCPLIIAVPVAIIAAISWCAKRGIIIKDPIALERAYSCKVLITDKTGTLTVGAPSLEAIELRSVSHAKLNELELLQLVASLEQYSKHPLAQPVLDYAKERRIVLLEVNDLSEVPGQGLRGRVGGSEVSITGRRSVIDRSQLADLSSSSSGLECIVQCDGVVVGLLRFRDRARADSQSFVEHLGGEHGFKDIVLLSGDRDEEVQYLAQQLNIKRIYANRSPEEKVLIVREETKRYPTIFLGDGINDAPALTAATVGIAFGPRSDITSEAAGAVILEPSLVKVDQFLHISGDMRRIALQSAVGGMVCSILGMALAAVGFLTPVTGAILQEGIDLFAVLNALRVGRKGRDLGFG
jgi:heavy metal translocating P-type ATPase